jgi:hypothetical protein
MYHRPVMCESVFWITPAPFSMASTCISGILVRCPSVAETSIIGGSFRLFSETMHELWVVLDTLDLEISLWSTQ